MTFQVESVHSCQHHTVLQTPVIPLNGSNMMCESPGTNCPRAMYEGHDFMLSDVSEQRDGHLAESQLCGVSIACHRWHAVSTRIRTCTPPTRRWVLHVLVLLRTRTCKPQVQSRTGRINIIYDEFDAKLAGSGFWQGLHVLVLRRTRTCNTQWRVGVVHVLILK